MTTPNTIDNIRQRLSVLQEKATTLRAKRKASTSRDDLMDVSRELGSLDVDIEMESNALALAVERASSAGRQDQRAHARALLAKLGKSTEQRQALAQRLDKLSEQMAATLAEYRRACQTDSDDVSATFKIAIHDTQYRLNTSQQAQGHVRENSGYFVTACATMLLRVFNAGNGGGEAQLWRDVLSAVDAGAGCFSNKNQLSTFSKAAETDAKGLACRLAVAEQALASEEANQSIKH